MKTDKKVDWAGGGTIYIYIYIYMLYNICTYAQSSNSNSWEKMGRAFQDLHCPHGPRFLGQAKLLRFKISPPTLLDVWVETYTSNTCWSVSVASTHCIVLFFLQTRIAASVLTMYKAESARCHWAWPKPPMLPMLACNPSREIHSVE